MWGAAHEYGHRVPGVDHPPHSRNDQPPVVDYGHYDVMNGNSSWPKYQQGLMPLHSLQLDRAQWKATQEIATTTLDLRIGDICDPASVLYKVATPNPLQKFLLVNYQASGFDLKYGNSGLLIWHIVEQLAWDLEVATGKFTGGQPDPEAGQDLLEEPGSYVGSATDFFPASATTHFTQWRIHTRISMRVAMIRRSPLQRRCPSKTSRKTQALPT